MRVTNIQHFSIGDGPGIRTTVFTAGCNLRCRWCHNPEAMRSGGQVLFDRDRCIRCRSCMAVCPSGVHRITESGNHDLERSRCSGCFLCTEVCPSGALRAGSREYSREELLEEIMQDEMFYRGGTVREQGGVTFSGGEPLLQGEQLCALLRQCRSAGVGTAVDTAANLPLSRIEPVLEWADLLLIDCKAYSEELHCRGTGVSNRQILSNLAALAGRGPAVWVRVPVIPGFNDSVEEMGRIADFLGNLPLERVELLPYHEMGKKKYKLLGLSYGMEGTKPPTEDRMKELLEIFRGKGVRAFLREP